MNEMPWSMSLRQLDRVVSIMEMSFARQAQPRIAWKAMVQLVGLWERLVLSSGVSTKEVRASNSLACELGLGAIVQ